MKTEQNYSGVPVIDADKQYWFVRTYSGELFEDFYTKNYVGLGVNNVPQKLIANANSKNLNQLQSLQDYIDKNTDYKKGAATKLAREFVSFQHEIKKGDTVIMPSRNSSRLAI